MMLSADTAITVFINSFAHRWWSFDAFVCLLASNHLFKGGLVMAVFCFNWFRSGESSEARQFIEKRMILLYSVLICIPGLVVTRKLAAILPFRERPLFITLLHMRRAYTFDSDALDHWSSFPSDHAVLFFALSTGMYLVNKKAGIFLYLYTILGVALPRIFLGIHYPTDILAGAALGVLLGYSAKWFAWRSMVTGPILRLQEFSPGIFYACFFFLVYQTADLYGPLRGGVQVAEEIVHVWLKAIHST